MLFKLSKFKNLLYCKHKIKCDYSAKLSNVLLAIANFSSPIFIFQVRFLKFDYSAMLLSLARPSINFLIT